MLHSHLLYLVAASPPSLIPTHPSALPVNSFNWSSPSRLYFAALNTFLHTLRGGLPWSSALAALAYLPLGHFSSDGRVFCTPSVGLPGGLPDMCLPLCDSANPDALTLFFSGPASLLYALRTLSFPAQTARPRPASASSRPGPRAGSCQSTSGSKRRRPVTSCPSS